MGELDEAIRQHIALKRQHGVPDSELRELEQEAFGPAERPAAPSEVTPAEPHAVPELFREQPGEPTTEAPDEGAPPAADAPPIVDVPTEESVPQFEAEEPEHPEPGPEPGPEVPPPPPAPEPAPPEPPAPAAEPGQETDPEAELGLTPDDGPSFFDQDLGEAEEEAERSSGDTGEESLYDELDALLGDDEGGGTAVEEEEQVEEEPAEEEQPEDSAEEGDSLLEETPDFLQDAPEQDDLWFDQQPPKDFDFDD
jgi:CapZ-interacting protein